MELIDSRFDGDFEAAAERGVLWDYEVDPEDRSILLKSLDPEFYEVELEVEARLIDPETGYSEVGAVVGATYPEMGKRLREIMPKSYILVPGYGAQGGKGKDLVNFFNKDGLGAIVNSSRGIIAAWKNEKYAGFGEEGYAEASRQAVLDMQADIASAF